MLKFDAVDLEEIIGDVLLERRFDSYEWRTKTWKTKGFIVKAIQGGSVNSKFHVFDTQGMKTVQNLQNIKFLGAQTGNSVPVDASSFKYIGGKALLVGGMKNHWHFLINFLPRLGQAIQFSKSRYDTVIFHKLTKAQKKFVSEIIPHHIQILISPEDERILIFDELIVPSFFHNLSFEPLAIREMQANLLPTLQSRYSENIEITDGMKIYIERPKNNVRRAVENDEEVYEILRKEGFQKWAPERSTLMEQVQVMRHAQFLVGAHGAGMANMIFMKPQSRVLVFDYKKPSEMEGLATCSGLQVRSIACEQVDNGAIERRLWNLRVSKRDLQEILSAYR